VNTFELFVFCNQMVA